jgi:hypothetical protein
MMSPIANEGSQGISHQGTCHPGGEYSSGHSSSMDSVTSSQPIQKKKKAAPLRSV